MAQGVEQARLSVAREGALFVEEAGAVGDGWGNKKAEGYRAVEGRVGVLTGWDYY